MIQRILEFFYPIFKKVLKFDVYAYLAVGAMNTVLNIAIFALLFEIALPQRKIDVIFLQIPSYTICLIIAFIITVPTGFWLAKNFAFNKHNNENSVKQLGKYFLVVSQGLISDYIILIGLINIFSFQPTLAKVTSTIIVLSVNFLLQKHFTFKANKSSKTINKLKEVTLI